MLATPTASVASTAPAPSVSVGSAGEGPPATTKRAVTRRLRLSCGECRKKKLSCDRSLPCQRCVRAGRPGLCLYETVLRGSGQTRPHSAAAGSGEHLGQIRQLQDEVARLKELLSRPSMQQQYDSPCGSAAVTLRDSDTGSLVQGTDDHDMDQARHPSPAAAKPTAVVGVAARSQRGHYGQRTLFQFFEEISPLLSFVRETADEWFCPRGISLRKSKLVQDARHAETGAPDALEELLPSKADTDCLVSFYLDNFEQLHRVVHVPTFEKEYASYWALQRPRPSAMTALVLAMVSVSTPTSTSTAASANRGMPPKWMVACDEWLAKQALKSRELVYYQVSCLVYIAKRTNMIRKKRFWIETGALTYNAVLYGLHLEPCPRLHSPYVREMRKRIWAVVRELDLQNSLEYGLPTILHAITANVTAPANLDDADFDKTTRVSPAPRPADQHTRSSFQFLSDRSWALRLQVSRILSSGTAGTSGMAKALDDDSLWRHTRELTQLLDSLPPWATREAAAAEPPPVQGKPALLAAAFLQFQLKECILALHRPYLQGGPDRHSLSEIVCYHTCRDVLALNQALAASGVQSLALLREDLLTASLTLTRITLTQPKDSTGVIAACAEASVGLLEQCLPFAEDRYLHCFYGEPWCPLTMCGAIMLIKMHLGKETLHSAKSACAQRFFNLYYKHFTRQETAALDEPARCNMEITFPLTERLGYGYPDDFSFDSLDFNTNWEYCSSVHQPG